MNILGSFYGHLIRWYVDQLVSTDQQVIFSFPLKVRHKVVSKVWPWWPLKTATISSEYRDSHKMKFKCILEVVMQVRFGYDFERPLQTF